MMFRIILKILVFYGKGNKLKQYRICQPVWPRVDNVGILILLKHGSLWVQNLPEIYGFLLFLFFMIPLSEVENVVY